MRKEDFVVGKKYIFDNRGAKPCVCLAIASDGFPVLESESKGVWKTIEPQSYKEYKEPKTGSIWVNVYEKPILSACHETRVLADARAGKHRIACIELKWTEGDGLPGPAD